MSSCFSGGGEIFPSAFFAQRIILVHVSVAYGNRLVSVLFCSVRHEFGLVDFKFWSGLVL